MINPIDSLWSAIEETKIEQSPERRRQNINHLLSDFHTAVTNQTRRMTIDEWKIGSIFDSLDNLQVSSNEIELFALDVLKLESTAFVSKGPEIPTYTLEFFCDIDGPDINGSMMERLVNGITEKLPIVTTRSLIQGAGLFKPSDIPRKLIVAMASLAENYRCYSEGSFIVLLPRGIDKEQMDFAETLQEVPVSDLFRVGDQKPSIEQFTTLFTENPKSKKFIYIAGHGNMDNMAGMSLEHYSTFLKWAKQQSCEGLLVTSCFGGGVNSLLHLGKDELDVPVGYRQLEEAAVPFPVFIRSVGDYSTHGMQQAERGNAHLIARLTQLLNSNRGGRTTRQIKKLWEEIEGTKDKAVVNMMQAYFPTASDSPTGFRTIGEGGRSLSLTYSRYRQLQIQEGRISSSGCSYINLFPLMIEVPLVFEKTDPLILSLIPGNAVHWLSEVHLAKLDPIDYLKKQFDFSNMSDLSANKLFYFGSLRHGEKELTDLLFNAKSGICVYKKEGKFYLQHASSKKGLKEITPFQYYLEVMTEMTNSFASEQAVRAATGGQQSNASVLKNIDFTPYEEFFKSLQKGEKLTLAQLQKWIADFKLESHDLVQLIPHIAEKDEMLAIEIMKAYRLSPDLNDIKGDPLIISAVRGNNNQLLQWLLDQGADVNAINPQTKKSAMKIALYNDNVIAAEILLRDKNLKIEINTIEGFRLLINALDHPAILEKILNQFPGIHLSNGYDIYQEGYNMTLLNMAIEHGKTEAIRIILQRDVSLNSAEGNAFLPLKQAIISGNREVIAMLLSKGASLYPKVKLNEMYFSDTFPYRELIEIALRRLPLSLVKEMVSKDIPQQVDPKLKDVIREAVINTGDEEKINYILREYPCEAVIRGELSISREGVERLCIGGKWDLLRDLIANQKDMGHSIKINVISWIIAHKPLMILEVVQSKDWNLSSIALDVSGSTTIDIETQKKIIGHLMEIAGDPNLGVSVIETWNSPLERALSKNNKPLALYLLEQGVKAQPAMPTLIKFGDLDLVKHALDQGVNLEAPDQFSQSLLALALENDLSLPENREIARIIINKGGKLSTRANSPVVQKIISAGYMDLFEAVVERKQSTLKHNQKKTGELAFLSLQGEGPDREKIFLQLKKLGANLDEPVEGKVASLFTGVILYGSTDLVEACLEEGASFEVKEGNSHLMKPLEAAALRNDELGHAIFKQLVDHGADVKQKATVVYQPLLTVLTGFGLVELVKYCFDRGASFDAYEAHEAVAQAFRSGNREMVEEIRSRGINLELDFLRDKDAVNLIQNAFKNGGIDGVYLVLEHFPDDEKIIKGLSSIVNDLLFSDNLEALQHLQEKGLKVDGNWIVQDYGYEGFCKSFGLTSRIRHHLLSQMNEPEQKRILADAFKYLIDARDYEMIEFAVEHGVNLNKASYMGPPIIFLAALEYKDPKLVSILLKGNPNLTFPIPGEPPLSVIEIARQMGLNDIVSILEAHPSK